MKKNEKVFLDEKNLENVSGGAMASGIETEVETGDISLVNVNKTTSTTTRDSHNVSTSKNPKLEGNITIGGNFSM